MLLDTAVCKFWASELQQVARTHSFFHIWTSTCTSRHSGVLFLDVLISKFAPNMRCFVHFDLKTCFSPQRRAIFDIVAWKCAFRRSNVPFLISALSTWLRARRFSELTFWPTRPRNHWKNTATRDFPNISCVCAYLPSSDFRTPVTSFFWLCFSSLLFNCPYCRKLDF